MILPVVAYGHTTLRIKALPVDKNHSGLNAIINNMFETMYASAGVGLAAPQVNLSLRIIVLDASSYAAEHPELEDYRKVFLNPQILEENGEEWTVSEGCLSLPDIREDVSRKSNVRLQYYDEQWNLHDEWFDGIVARIIQHEYDHLEGKLFIDHISPLRKMLLKKRLADISRGDITVSYKMTFPLRKKHVA
ncbi:MAG TPA: peptide deformylase [Bacteroidales bacterium]|nr:peptide deformylase [Bacteroidales bacterium]